MSADTGDREVIVGCNEFAVLKRQLYSHLSGSRPDIFFSFLERRECIKFEFISSNSFACNPTLSLLKRVRFRVKSEIKSTCPQNYIISQMQFFFYYQILTSRRVPEVN